MQVTTITITRSRKVQPEQYGNAEASVTLVANVDEGDDWKKTAKSLLTDARGLVYENLGLKLPARAADDEVDTAQETATVEADEGKAGEKKPAGKKATGKKGRPSTKKNTPPAEAAPSSDDVPDDSSDDNIRSNPEDRQNPDDDIPDDDATQVHDAKAVKAAAEGDAGDDIPDDGGESTSGGEADEDPNAEYGVGDLQSYLTQQVKDKKISAQRVREIISSHGVARTSDLPADKVLVVKQQIEKEVEGA